MIVRLDDTEYIYELNTEDVIDLYLLNTESSDEEIDLALDHYLDSVDWDMYSEACKYRELLREEIVKTLPTAQNVTPELLSSIKEKKNKYKYSYIADCCDNYLFKIIEFYIKGEK